MQKILSLVRETLTDLKLAIEGTIIMSENLKSSLDSMYDARWANLFSNKSSLENLKTEEASELIGTIAAVIVS